MARPRKERSLDLNPKSKPDKLDPQLMAKICFEIKYLSGKKTAEKTKGQILNEYGISYDSYYNWLKKLDKNNPQYDPVFENAYKELLYEFLTQEDNAWLIRSKEVYAGICDLMETLTEQLNKEILERQPLNNTKITALTLCFQWGIKTQEMFMALKDVEQTKFLLGIDSHN